MPMPLLSGFDDRRISTAPGVDLRVCSCISSGKPPLLCVHGHPQTHLIWHKVAPALAAHFSLVLVDLRGYGDSSTPEGGTDHVAYAKRTMANDLLVVMQTLGYARFRVLAHDRGARVAHRLALDHPAAVERLVLLDIAPTLAMYEGTDDTFARAYWHWFFLIQRAPVPERFIEQDPAFYVRQMMSGRFASQAERDAAFDPAVVEEYVRCAARPGVAHAICEDYRASATIDLVHDRADRDAGRRVTAPLLALWGARGIIARCFDALALWRAVAGDVRGEALPCGHYIPEEAPQALLDAALPFLRKAPSARRPAA